MSVPIRWDHDPVDDGWVLDDEPAVSVAPSCAAEPAPVAAPRRSFAGALAGGLLIGTTTMLSIAFAAGEATPARVSHAQLDLVASVTHDARHTRVAVAVAEMPSAGPAEPEAPAEPAAAPVASEFDALYAAAREAARSEDHERALETIDRALAIRPNSGKGLDFKARLLLDMGEVFWALEVANKSVMATPDRAASWLTKAEIHHELKGNEAAERFSLEHALEAALPGSRHARRAQEMLDRL